MSISVKRHYPASVKVAAIADYCSETMSQKAVGKKYGVSHVTIINWMKEKEQILQECKDSAKLFPVFDLVTGNPRQMPDTEELALKLKEKTPESLRMELKALHEENAYLTDKLAYMEALFSLEGIPVGKVGKKRHESIWIAIHKSGCTNVRRLCVIADVSRKSYYAYLKRRGVVDEEFERILAFIRQVQAETCFAVGYRHMTQKVRLELCIKANQSGCIQSWLNMT